MHDFSDRLARLLHSASVLRFRFSEGLAGPHRSTAGRLNERYALLAISGVHVDRHASTTVVSRALAGPRYGPSDVPVLRRGGTPLLYQPHAMESTQRAAPSSLTLAW